jgi:hypothetical protein
MNKSIIGPILQQGQLFAACQVHLQIPETRTDEEMGELAVDFQLVP